jgi:hypothetical protein
MHVPSFDLLSKDADFEKVVRRLLQTPDAIGALRELLLRSDLDALLHIRGIEGPTTPTSCLEAVEVFKHNERMRNVFRVALRENEEDPFGV